MAGPTPVVPWLNALALLVLGLDILALTVIPPALRHDTVPQQVLNFAEHLPTIRRRSGDSELVSQLVRSLSLEQKVGQLLLVGGWEAPTSEIPEAVQQWHLGNLVLTDEGLQGLQDLAELTRDSQEVARSQNAGVPLLIAAQQEGGGYDALRVPGLVRLPSPGDLGEYAKAEEVERAYGYLAGELAALGINTVLAPNLDLAMEARNPLAEEERLFGASSRVVTQSGLAAIAGLQNGGVLACARQFPGVGAATTDVSRSLTLIRLSLNDLESSDLEPFRKAISNEVALIQVGPACYPLLQGERHEPAFQSRAMVQSLLRDRLQYTGVVVTGDLADPAADQDASTRLDRAIAALKAGCDLLLYTGGAEGAEALAEGLVEAVTTGTLPVEIVDTAVSRILRLKSAYELFAAIQDPPVFLATGELPDRQVHRQGIGQLYENMEFRQNPNQAAKVVRGESTPLPIPLHPSARLLVVHVDRQDFPSRYRGLTVGELVQERFPAALDFPVTLLPGEKEKELEALGALAPTADVILLATWKQLGPGQRQLFQTVGKSGRPVVVLSRFENEKDNVEMPEGTIQYYWVLNNSRSVLGALDQCFSELILPPPLTSEPSQGGTTALPMPSAIPSPGGPDPLVEADASGEGPLHLD